MGIGLVAVWYFSLECLMLIGFVCELCVFRELKRSLLLTFVRAISSFPPFIHFMAKYSTWEGLISINTLVPYTKILIATVIAYSLGPLGSKDTLRDRLKTLLVTALISYAFEIGIIVASGIEPPPRMKALSSVA